MVGSGLCHLWAALGLRVDGRLQCSGGCGLPVVRCIHTVQPSLNIELTAVPHLFSIYVTALVFRIDHCVIPPCPEVDIALVWPVRPYRALVPYQYQVRHSTMEKRKVPRSPTVQL